MAANSDIISQLEGAKDVLQKQCDNASGARMLQLMTVIHQIADEIGAIESEDLANAPYVPTTDPFRQTTADGKAFLATLKTIQNAFGYASDAAKACDTIIKVISKL